MKNFALGVLAIYSIAATLAFKTSFELLALEKLKNDLKDLND